MALLTKRGLENLLKRIMETGGLTENMEEDVQRLRDDFDEREGILNRYGESYDNEDEELNEYEWKDRDEDTVFTPDEEKYVSRSEYDELKRKYIDRFFSYNASDWEQDNEEALEEDEKALKAKTIEDLFE